MPQPAPLEIVYSRLQYLRLAAFASTLAVLRKKTIWLALGFSLYFSFSQVKDLRDFWLSLAGTLVTLTSLALFLYLLLYLRLSSFVKREPELLGPYGLSAEGEGLRWQNGDTGRLQAWQEIQRVLVLRGHVLVFEASGCVFIPRHAFTNDGHFRAWREAVRERKRKRG